MRPPAASGGDPSHFVVDLRREKNSSTAAWQFAEPLGVGLVCVSVVQAFDGILHARRGEATTLVGMPMTTLPCRRQSSPLDDDAPATRGSFEVFCNDARWADGNEEKVVRTDGVAGVTGGAQKHWVRTCCCRQSGRAQKTPTFGAAPLPHRSSPMTMIAVPDPRTPPTTGVNKWNIAFACKVRGAY